MTDKQLKLMHEISRAVHDLKSTELIFESEWLFTHPSQSLKIGDEMLHSTYDIPTGFDGFGIEDLEKLTEVGFLEKIYESEEDPITLEKVIKYKVNISEPV